MENGLNVKEPKPKILCPLAVKKVEDMRVEDQEVTTPDMVVEAVVQIDPEAMVIINLVHLLNHLIEEKAPVEVILHKTVMVVVIIKELMDKIILKGLVMVVFIFFLKNFFSFQKLEQGAYGGYPGYDYGPNAGGYDPSGNYNRGPAGYNYNPEYSAYNPNYGNPYPNSYNPAYNSGYPSQYQAGYPQTYDPMATGMGPVNPSATANPNMQQQQQQQQPSTTKTSDPSTGGTPGPQPTGAPTGQYPSGYGPESGYNPASYGYNPMQGDYSNAGYMGYGNPAQQGDSRNIQGGSQPKYGGPAQALSPSQSGGYGGKQEQPGVGPIRGGAKKGGPGPEQRYYQPY